MGIVSDTHGVLDERVLQAVTASDLVVHAGDVGDVDVLEQLRGVCVDLIAVRGNNDVPGKVSAPSRAPLAGLPLSAQVDLPGGLLVVEHGDRVVPARNRHHKLRSAWPDARLVVYGHSHRLCVDCTATPWVANPGAAGRARTFGGPSLLLLEASPSRWNLTQQRFDLAR